MKLVLIESSEADAELVLKELSSGGLEFDLVRATTKAQIRGVLGPSAEAVDAVLCAYEMKDLDVFDALDILKASTSAAPLIVVNGGVDDERAAECIRSGAADYILAGDLGRLNHALTQALHHASAERDSRDVLRRYLSLFENLPMAVLEATGGGQILHANSAAVAIFGFADLESLRAVSAFDLYVDPDERRALLARLETVGHVPEFECRMRRADGSEFWFSRVVHAVRVEDGTVMVWETIGRDMTERRGAQLALANSEERLRSLLRGAPVAIVAVDTDGFFTFAGGSVFTQLGLDPSTIVGLKVTESFPDRPDFVELWSAALEQDTHMDVEFQDRTFHVRSGPFRPSPGGEVTGVLAVGFDNTERVEADRALRHSEAEAEQQGVKRADQQTVLLELSRAGLEGRETTEFLATAATLVASGSRTQFATILELESHNRLRRVAYHGPERRTPPEPPPIDGSFLVTNSQQPEMPVSAYQYQTQPEFQRAKWMVERGILASMAVGITGPIQPYGILSVHSNVAREFSPDDFQFMQLAATIISVAVERKVEEKQRRLLLSRLVNAQEIERKTIAEDIHDDAVQIMTAANLRLEMFRRALTDPVQIDAAETLQDTIALAIGRLRNLLFELIPPDLDRHGIEAAMRRHLEQFEIESGVRWEFDVRLDDEPPLQERIILFRIFQEALVNVRKHAHATCVAAVLESVDGGVLVRLTDDGTGFHEPATDPAVGHLGLASMRERAEIAGGWWRLTSKRSQGTKVSAWVPVSPVKDAAEATASEAMALG